MIIDGNLIELRHVYSTIFQGFDLLASVIGLYVDCEFKF